MLFKKLILISLAILASVLALVFVIYITAGNSASDDYEIVESLNTSCEVDTDCELPHHFAIRSICPYQSLCIENTCTVVCPAPFTGVSE